MLKDNAPLLFIANMEDENAIGGRLDAGFCGPFLSRYGFEVAASLRMEGVCIGYMTKFVEAKPEGFSSAKASSRFDRSKKDDKKVRPRVKSDKPEKPGFR